MFARLLIYKSSRSEDNRGNRECTERETNRPTAVIYFMVFNYLFINVIVQNYPIIKFHHFNLIS